MFLVYFAQVNVSWEIIKKPISLTLVSLNFWTQPIQKTNEFELKRGTSRVRFLGWKGNDYGCNGNILMSYIWTELIIKRTNFSLKLVAVRLDVSVAKNMAMEYI